MVVGGHGGRPRVWQVEAESRPVGALQFLEPAACRNGRSLHSSASDVLGTSLALVAKSTIQRWARCVFCHRCQGSSRPEELWPPLLQAVRRSYPRHKPVEPVASVRRVKRLAALSVPPKDVAPDVIASPRGHRRSVPQPVPLRRTISVFVNRDIVALESRILVQSSRADECSVHVDERRLDLTEDVLLDVPRVVGRQGMGDASVAQTGEVVDAHGRVEQGPSQILASTSTSLRHRAPPPND